MSSLYEALKLIPDYRHPKGTIYRLADLHFMMICAILCGMSDAVEIVEYISWKFDEFRKLLGITRIPSHDTISRVYIHTDWTYLTKHLHGWLERNYPMESRLYQKMRVIHIDGKAIRSSANKGAGEKPPYQLNYMEEGRTIAVKSLPIGEKENEIARIPELLDFLDVSGAIVTVDAIGCQRSIMRKILSKGGHFMFPVKENQQRLYEAIKSECRRLESMGRWDVLPKCRLSRLDHGRAEEYRLTMVEDTSFLLEEFSPGDEFMGIGRIGVIEKTTVRKPSGKKETSTAYVVTDLCSLEPESFLGIKLSHWNIEAQHWKLDVQLDEDRARQRLGNSRTNSTAFRRLLLALAKSPEHPNWTVSKFRICCQNNFDMMVDSILRFRDTEN